MATLAVSWPPRQTFLFSGSKLDELQFLSLDMLLHDCSAFFNVCMELTDAAQYLETSDPPSRLLNRDDLAFIGRSMELLSKVLSALDINRGGFALDCEVTILKVRVLKDWPGGDSENIQADHLARDYRRIRDGLLQEIQKHKFVYLPGSADEYFNQERLFGAAVYDRFPSARFEIREAGNAFAFEMWTASVFHLMRAGEIGLRALAKDRRISHLPKKKDAPVEMGCWDDIIKELEEQAGRIANWPNALGDVKVQAQEFYNGATMELRGFKDRFRNHVMHTRAEYRRADAESAMDHVKRFMNLLGTRISETRQTPLIWTKAQLR